MAYAKLRRLRRRGEKAQALNDLIKTFAAQPSLESFQSLARLLAAQAAEALLDADVADPDTIQAVARALETMNGLARVELEREKLKQARERAGRDGAPAETKTLQDVAREAYGIEIGGGEQ
jgi:hypothetical protein